MTELESDLDQALKHYEERVRLEVEAEHDGEFMIINVETGDYAPGSDPRTGVVRANERFGLARTSCFGWVIPLLTALDT
jgi:hypothetical protein